MGEALPFSWIANRDRPLSQMEEGEAQIARARLDDEAGGVAAARNRAEHLDAHSLGVGQGRDRQEQRVGHPEPDPHAAQEARAAGPEGGAGGELRPAGHTQDEDKGKDGQQESLLLMGEDRMRDDAWGGRVEPEVVDHRDKGPPIGDPVGEAERQERSQEAAEEKGGRLAPSA